VPSTVVLVLARRNTVQLGFGIDAGTCVVNARAKLANGTSRSFGTVHLTAGRMFVRLADAHLVAESEQQ